MTNSKQFDNLKLKDIQLRKATIKDISKVALVLNKSYNISSIKEGEEVFLEELKKNHTYLLAEKNSEILGITTYIIHGLPKHGLAELDRIAVMPNFRNLGIGKLLFAELINSLKNDYISKNSKLRKLFGLPDSSQNSFQQNLVESGDADSVTLETYKRSTDNPILNTILTEKFSSQFQTTCSGSGTDCIISTYSMFDKYFNSYFSAEQVLLFV